MTMNENELMRLRYSVPEAAEMLGLSVATMWRRVKAGQIKTVRDGGRVLITYDELRRYATRGTELQAS
jgi:excisionase family DNA binding protein